MKRTLFLSFGFMWFQLFGATTLISWNNKTDGSWSGEWFSATPWNTSYYPGDPAHLADDYSNFPQAARFSAGKGAYTVSFPQGACTSFANLYVLTQGGDDLTFDGRGTDLVMPTMERDCYGSWTYGNALRFQSGGRFIDVTPDTDHKSAIARLSDFLVNIKHVQATGIDFTMDGGTYDFVAPVEGVWRTDVTVNPGLEGYTGSDFGLDKTFHLTAKDGVWLRTSNLAMGSGFTTNLFTLSASTGLVTKVFTMGGTKNGTNPVFQRFEVRDGACLVVGSDAAISSGTLVSLNTDSAAVRRHENELLVTGAGSEVVACGRVQLNYGRTAIRVEDGGCFSATGEVHLCNSKGCTNTLAVVGGSVDLIREFYAGYASYDGTTLARIAVTNGTMTSLKGIYTRTDAEVSIAGDQTLIAMKELVLGSTDGVPGSTVMTVDGGTCIWRDESTIGSKGGVNAQMDIRGGTVTFSNALYVGGSSGNRGTLKVSGGELVLPNSTVAVGRYSGSTGAVCLDGGCVRAPSIVGQNGTATFSADGGMFSPNKTAKDDSYLSGFSSAILGAGGLTLDSAYDMTLNQSFVSKEGETGRIVFKGGHKLTLPANRTFAVAVDLRGGTTLECLASQVGGLALGDEEEAATVNVAIDSPVAVDGDVDIRNARVVLSGTVVTGETYPLVTCTGDVSAGTAAAWEAAELDASLAPAQYAEFSVADGAEGGKVLQMTVKEMKVVPLTLASGAETIVTNIALNVHDQLEVTVGEGAELTLAGVVTGDSIVKKGTGKLIVGNAANQLASGFYLEDGLLSVASAAMLGDGTGYLSGGTLEVTGDTAFSRSLVITPANDAQAVVVKTEADVTMPLPQASVGAFLKRGTGKLTLTVAESTSAFAPMSVGGNRTATVVSFPESGVVPVAAYYSVHVIEGELAFKGLADDVVVTMPNSFAVGLNTLDGTVAPKLTLDHVAVAASGCMVDNAGYMTKDGSFCQKTFVALKNGAALSVANVYNGRSTKNQGITTEVTVEDSTITATAAYWVNDSDGTNIPLNTFRNSNVYCAAFGVQGCGGTNVFDNCVVAKNANGDGVTLQQQDNKTSYFLFRNGTVFRHSTLNCNADRTGYPNTPYIFAFDGATWDMGAKDVAYTNSYISSGKVVGITLYVHSIGEGVTFNPGEGYTWSLRLQKPIQGNGKILVRGAGTLDLNGETYENAKIGGTGVLRNVALAGTKLTVCADVEAAGALTLGEDVTCTATKGCVDFGRTEADPLPYKDLSYPLAVLNAGPVTIPGAAAWRVANTGVRGLKGCFAEDSGVLSLTGLDVTGLMLIFR